MNYHSRQQRAARRERRIARRLAQRQWRRQARPMLRAANIDYDVANRTRALGVGGIGAMHLMARKIGLIERLDDRLALLKIHLPYHESDHVLNIAYNILSGRTCLEDIELWRNDEVYLDPRARNGFPIRRPPEAGDFCRRFTAADGEALQEAINETRLVVCNSRVGRAHSLSKR